MDRPKKKGIVGEVVKKSGSKTVKVVTKTLRRHPKYEKVIRRTASYMVHDEKEQAKVGDKVTIVTCRPISKTKKWRLTEVLESKLG